MSPSDQNVRAAEHLAVAKRENYERADRLFGGLMVLQWLAGVAAALLLSPRTWVGGESYLHPHVSAALFLGGAISALPVYLAHKHPGKTWTRHVIAIAQMLMSSLFVHLSGGRIETHFHVFGSLAFLAFYRDWRVLLTATLVAGLDHFLRGLFWPETVYGVLAASNWRTLEHVGWVLFEDIVLCISMGQSIREMAHVADRRAALEGANEQLKSSESRLAEAQTVAHLGNWDWELATQKVTWSDEQYRLFGFAPGEIEPSYERYFSCIHPDDRQAARKFADDMLANRKGASINLRVVHPDGQVRVLHWYAHIIVDLAGNAIRVSGTIQDVTAELWASEERTRLIMATAHDPLVGMDSTGAITDWNPQAETTFGWSRAEALGQPLHELIISPKFREMHVRGLKHFLATGEGSFLNKLIEVSALHRDGHELPIELRISPIPKGDSFMFSASLRDITERRHANEELLRAKETAESASRTKSEFLANMSHEIRTPMNGVIGMTGLLLGTPLTQDQRDFAETIQTSGEALLSIVNDILDFSKIEAGKLELEIVDIDLADVLRGTVSLLQGQAKAKGLELRASIDPDVPTRLRGDAGRLRQVLINLIGNGLKFTTSGHISIHVSLDHQNESVAGLQFRIADTGIGITTEAQSRLFRAFMQADGSTTRRYGGTGLGLAICKELVAKMSGEIGVESLPGTGSTFWFTVQLPKQLHAAEARTRVPDVSSGRNDPSASTSAEQNLQHSRILIAEDNGVNQRVAAAQLKSLGYSADVVTNGVEVLEALGCIPYDIVLMDCQMPELDGYETTRRIREAGGHQPYIIAMTANAMEGDRELCLAAGMDSYVSKPVRTADLKAALSERDPVSQRDSVDVAVLLDLQTLAQDGMPNIYAELIELFTQSTPGLLKQARSLLHDPRNLSMVTHTIKGSCSNFGARRMQALCEELEELGRAGKTAGADKLVTAIEHEYGKVCRALKSHHVAS